MSKRILVVEDVNSVRKFIELSLKLSDFEVISAVDGQDALELLSKTKIDLLITDLKMPNIDGLSLIKTIRNDPKYEALPVIILSSSTTDEDIKIGLEAGADSYLMKPFNVKHIQHEIEKYLKS